MKVIIVFLLVILQLEVLSFSIEGNEEEDIALKKKVHRIESTVDTLDSAKVKAQGAMAIPDSPKAKIESTTDIPEPTKIKLEDATDIPDSTKIKVEDATNIPDSTKTKADDATDLPHSEKGKAPLDEDVTKIPESSPHDNTTKAPISKKPYITSEETKQIMDILKEKEGKENTKIHIKIIIGVVAVCIVLLVSICCIKKYHKKRETPLNADPEERIPSLQKDQTQSENGDVALTQSNV